MALMNCAECGKQVSDKAAACPHCGAPIASSVAPSPPALKPKAVTFTPASVAALIIAAVVVFVFVLAMSGMRDGDAQSRAREREAVRYCESEYERMNADRQYTPDMLRFHSLTCKKMRDDFQTKWGRAP